MSATGDEANKESQHEEERSQLKTASAYLWRGFSGDLTLTRFDLFSKVTVTDVAFGNSHSLFLTSTGDIYVNGTNDMGQLGLGSAEVIVREEPVKVEGLSGPATRIACGKNHSAVVMESGQVFCWGSSKDGQCGTGSLDLVLSPVQVALEIHEGFCQHGVPRPAISVDVKDISCGASHTLAVSYDGEVWAWGAGPSLGLIELMHAPVPRRIETLQGQVVVSVCSGERHSMALILRGEKSSSRSGSPLKTKGKVEAKDVKEDKHFPSRCTVCNKEIYTYTDTSDMCIIDTLHDCNVNESIRSVDSTIVDDVSSSNSSNDLAKKSATSSPDKTVVDAAGIGNVTSPNADNGVSKDEDKKEKETGKIQQAAEEGKTFGNTQSQDNLPSQDVLNTSAGDEDTSGLMNESTFLENATCDMSILVIPGENPFESGDNAGNAEVEQLTSETEEGKAGVEVPAKVVGDESLQTTSDSAHLKNAAANLGSSERNRPTEAKGKDDSSAQSGKNSEEGSRPGGEERSSVERTVSNESDDVVWKRRSESEEIEELKLLAQREHTRSPSTVSVKSLNLLNQSEAMEYLQRQFEDEKETKAASIKKSGAATPKTGEAKAETKEDKPAVSPKNVLGYSSGMLAQVKSMTSQAFTSMQGFSMFGSNSETTESEDSPTNPQIELTTVKGGEKGQSSEGNKKKLGGEDCKGQSGQAGSSDGAGTACSDVKSNLDSAALRVNSDSTSDSIPDPASVQIKKSGTFMEWTQELSTADDPSSLTRDSNQRSLRTIQMKQRNLNRASLSSMSEVTEQQQPPPKPPVITATDVWVWGKNDQGQLGLGDQLDRAQPILVKSFVGRHVVKLAAGENHSLALTANSQAYSWGSNSYGQLGQLEASHAPAKIKFVKGFTAWDIGAGAVHSVFLGDSPSLQPDVLYCGKHPSQDAHSSMKKTNSPVALADIKKLGWIIKVMAGGSSCACKVLNPHPPETKAVFELAATERAFYSQLIKTSNILLRPLQRSSFYSYMDVFPYKSSLQNLVIAFGALTKKIGEGITDLTTTIQSEKPITQSLMLSCHSHFVETFQKYSKAFSNFLAVGGFDYCTKTGSEFFEKIQGSIRDLSDERDKSVNSSSLFMRAMIYPFFRLAEYSRILGEIITAVEKQDAKNQIQSAVLEWDSLKINFSAEHKVADATKTFWETSNPKLADSMRAPTRRMLRDSKTHPLLWPSGSRFSTRLFVLFNDVFLHLQSTGISSFPLETLWVESEKSDAQHPNAISIITPEERFDLQTSTPAQKAEWLISLNSAISKVLTNQKSIPSRHSNGERFTPPLIRHATHTFTKNGIYKDATYSGTWLSGKIHGTGQMKWPNGSVLEGNFKRGLMHGTGTHTIVKSPGNEVQKGNWKDGKLNGYASVSYANGDLYEGYFQDGQKFGHGMYQAGRHKSSCASVYIGEWLCNMKDGYGVQDDILKGEKYMGTWVEDSRHGPGVLVTLDGMYFEGNFVQNKMTGFGVMISDDNTQYEGDFLGITHLSGKGTLTLQTGDKLEGSFSGSLNEGLKINGTFIKSPSSPDSDQKSQLPGIQSKYFSRLCVAADSKWSDIFSHACSTLGQSQMPRGGKASQQIDTEKAWELVAVMVSAGRKALKDVQGISPSKVKSQQLVLEGLEKIPAHGMESLNTETVADISTYLTKAFDTVYHPLGQLMDSLVDVFRASYIGVGAHPRLLHHAMQEVTSYIRRIYVVVRILFPALPANGGPVHIYPPSKTGEIPRSTEEAKEFIEGLETEDPNLFVLTAAGILYPILLPKIYPPLFDLYALYNEKQDDRYWERVSKLNRQSDMGLMAYLGIEQRFWLMEDILNQDKTQTLSSIKDVCYAEAVDMLQQLSTAFSPLEKLKIIEQTFNEITKTVTLALKDDHMWCMDDLFPIFQFVVVRAKIHHLGAEIHMTEDLMEPHLEHGEFGLMQTTLKACYFQIQSEKMPHH